MQRRSFLLLPGLLPLAAGCTEEPTPAERAAVASAEALNDIVQLTEIAKQRHGQTLSPEEWNRVQSQIHSNQRSAALIRAVPLTNDDAPVFAPSSVFSSESNG